MKKETPYETAKQLGEKYLLTVKKNKYFGLSKPAVMFDIDDTLIHYSGKPIKPIIALLKKCKKEKMIILIITARDSVYKEQTIDQLKQLKIPYDFLYLRNPDDQIETFKSKIKQNLAETEGITTVMSIGDNYMDIIGDYSGYYIKLPNQTDPNLYHLNADGFTERIIG
uniref:Acid phosphatase n=1 Tax=viral metagenome TaxID=1070528 RepID=A0A6C0I812_9ZZZZ